MKIRKRKRRRKTSNTTSMWTNFSRVFIDAVRA